MKIAILGYSGSGKSTLAKKLSCFYNIPLLYLDKVQFQDNWAERDKSEALNLVSEFMDENSSWVIDGNYTGFLQSRRLKEADYIIYFRFNRFSCLSRVLKRNKKYKNKSRESIANGCIEKIDCEFLWWVLYKGRTKAKRKYYKNLLTQYKDKSILIKNQKQLTDFEKTYTDILI